MCLLLRKSIATHSISKMLSCMSEKTMRLEGFEIGIYKICRKTVSMDCLFIVSVFWNHHSALPHAYYKKKSPRITPSLPSINTHPPQSLCHLLLRSAIPDNPDHSSSKKDKQPAKTNVRRQQYKQGLSASLTSATHHFILPFLPRPTFPES